MEECCYWRNDFTAKYYLAKNVFAGKYRCVNIADKKYSLLINDKELSVFFRKG